MLHQLQPFHDTSPVVSRGFRTRHVAQYSATKEVYKRCVSLCVHWFQHDYIYIFIYILWAHKLWWSRAVNWSSDMGQLCFLVIVYIGACFAYRSWSSLLKSCAGTWSTAVGARVQMPNANVWTTVFANGSHNALLLPTSETYSGDACKYEKVLSLALIFRLKCMRSSS